MDDELGTYAPQSPDLSEYQSYEQPDAFSSSNTYYPPQHQHQPFTPPYQTIDHDPYASFPQPSYLQQQQPFPTMLSESTNGKSRAKTGDPLNDEFIPEPASAKPGSGRKSKKMKVEEEVCAKPAPGVEEGIEVKTKFPVARIKRIMQADEDVGKVAQVTPTAVCKFDRSVSDIDHPKQRANALYSKSTGTLHDFTCHESGQ